VCGLEQVKLWKSCGWMVNFLLMDRQPKYFSALRPSEKFGTSAVIAFSRPASLDRP
jgi:hypothetical protein